MVQTNKTQRWLGIGWETSGRNLLNLFGVLSWDSFWSDGRTPVDIITTPKAKTVDIKVNAPIVENKGNLPKGVQS